VGTHTLHATLHIQRFGRTLVANVGFARLCALAD